MSNKFDGLFTKPVPITAMDRTTAEARLIIAEEAERREELTGRLRAARLARDAAMPKAGKPAKPVKGRKKGA